METVTSLPPKVVADAELFMLRYKRFLHRCIPPIFVFFLMPEELDVYSVLGLCAFYLYVIFLSPLSYIFWKNSKVLWFQLYLSLIFGVMTTVTCKFVNINSWLFNEFQYMADGNVAPYWAGASFIFLVAAFWGSFEEAELAFYRSKGYEYKGWLGDL